MLCFKIFILNWGINNYNIVIVSGEQWGDSAIHIHGREWIHVFVWMSTLGFYTLFFKFNWNNLHNYGTIWSEESLVLK